ncbi:MAG TPA: ANTAR domain-containing protein, partial [Propionibacteriaceae bacterium]
HVIAAPVHIAEGQARGALNLYVFREEPLDEALITTAEVFARHIAADVSDAILHRSVVDLSSQLRSALTSRSVIEQAKGIVMGRDHCSSAAAFTKLVQTAQQRHLKLWSAAAAMVAEVESG